MVDPRGRLGWLSISELRSASETYFAVFLCTGRVVGRVNVSMAERVRDQVALNCNAAGIERGEPGEVQQL